MENPFQLIESRLSKIENLLFELKSEPKKELENSKQYAYSIREGAEFFHVSKVTFQVWKNKGLVSHTQIGRKLIIDLNGTLELLSVRKIRKLK